MWSDDQLVWASQILYSENLNLKSNSRYTELNIKPIQKVETWSDNILWFVNAHQDTGNFKTYWYWENWVVYQVDWTDNVANYTINAWADDVVNAINFTITNEKVYFITDTSSFSNVKLWEIDSNDLYDWIWSITNVITTGSVWTSLDKYPMYNYLDSFMYIWIGRDIFRVDNAWATKTFTLWTDDIIAITQLWWVFRLYQRDGRVLFWDWLNDAIDSSTSINDTIRSAIQHKGIDYIVWWVSKFFSNFYFLNWYRADLLEKTIITEATDWDKTKFGIIDSYKNIISFNGEIYFGIENAWIWWIYSFGNKKPQFPVAYENTLVSSPDNLSLEFTALWDWESSWSYYMWYNDSWKTAIAEYNIVAWFPTFQWSWDIYTPVFNAWAMSILKWIEEIVVYIDIPSWTSATLESSIDWWTYQTIKTLTDWRNKINTEKKEFYDIVFKVTLNANTAKDATPRFHDIKLIYTVKDEQ